MEKRIGIITKDGYVKTENGELFALPRRGTDREGYPEVLMDAEPVGGLGWMYRQSVKQFIGMSCSFYTNGNSYAHTFEILPAYETNGEMDG